jgi:hypothetical protein
VGSGVAAVGRGRPQAAPVWARGTATRRRRPGPGIAPAGAACEREAALAPVSWAFWRRHSPGCVGTFPADRDAGQAGAGAVAVPGHHGGGGGAIPHGERSHPRPVAGCRPAAGLLGAAPADHRRAGGLGDAAGHRPHRRPARPARRARVAPGRAGAAGRVRCRQLGAAHRGAAAAQPGPRRGPGGAKRTAARGPHHRRRGAAGLALCLSRGGGAGGRGRARGRLRPRPPALAHRRHPRQGTAGGAAGQCRDDQLPGRLRPARPVAARDRPGRGPVSHARRRRGGLRDRLVRRARPARLARARHLRAPTAAAADHRRRPAGTESHHLRDTAGPAPRPPAIHVHGRRGRPAGFLHRRPARGARPGRPLLPAGRLPRRTAPHRS